MSATSRMSMLTPCAHPGVFRRTRRNIPVNVGRSRRQRFGQEVAVRRYTFGGDGPIEVRTYE